MACFFHFKVKLKLSGLYGFAWFALWVSTVQAATPYYALDLGVYPGQALGQTAFVGPLDQSALNAALGPADRIAVSQGHFFTVGADGQSGSADDRRVRLYGVNLSYNANFPEPDMARQVARRLRSLGVNAVRLHHLDSTPDASADQAHSVLTLGAYPSFNRKAIERLKGFLKALKAEGIYANLNLTVGYRFRPGVDGVPPLQGVAAIPPGSPVQVFHPDLIALQTRYAQLLIRQLALEGDSQLAMVEIRNESSLAATWQAWNTHDWTGAVQGVYADELTRQWNAWLVRTYGSTEKACARWAGCASAGWQPLLTPGDADALRTGQQTGWVAKVMDRFYALLNTFKVWMNWQSSSALASGPMQRSMDFVRFIADTDQHYFETIKQAVRAVAGPLVPITGTQMGFGGRMNYLSQGGMDYLDEHFYVDHYDFPRAPWDANDWRIKDSSLTGTDMTTLVGLARHRDLRRPFVVSEYNQAYPNRQGAEMPTVVAVLASLQDWDGLFQFDYADGDNWGVLPSGFRLSGDWAKLAVTAQSARLFRAGLLPRLTAQSPQVLDAQTLLLGGALRRREGRGDPHGAVVQPGTPWTPEGIFQTQLGTLLDTTVGRSLSPVSPATPASAISSVAYSSDESRLVFTAPQLAGFAGKVAPGQRVDMGVASVELLNPRQIFATVLITSLDAQPLSSTQRMLVSVPGHVMGSQPGTGPARPQKLIPYPAAIGDDNAAGEPWWTLEPDASHPGKPSGTRDAQGPLWMERVPVKLTLKNSDSRAGQVSALQVYPLSLAGQRLPALPAALVRKQSGEDVIILQMEVVPQSPWYEIVRSFTPPAGQRP